VKVLGVTSEIYPLIKTGGLADVAGALPGALKENGVEVLTLVPGYPAVLKALEHAESLHSLGDLFGGPARLLRAKAKGLDLIVLEAAHLYDRPGNPYLGPDGKDWPDNAKRYAALATMAAALAHGLAPSFVPDLIHAHDWQAALTPAYLKFGPPVKTKTVLTVHNLAFQGHFPAPIFPTLGLPAQAFAISGVEYFGGVGYLKGGLALADAITTVSPTYAQEITTEAYGMGLEGLLRMRESVLHGIVNGIDTEVWNPATDPALPATFDAKRLQRRAENKRAVESRFGLEPGDGPLFCVISRLTGQKGIDLLAQLSDWIVARGLRLAILGSGEKSLEDRFLAASMRHKGRIGALIGYDEGLSHLMQGGCDGILIPSRFEPCGLTQLYGLRYGCVPIVARVGGLADTVIDANDAALGMGVASGIQFLPVDLPGLERAIVRAMELHRDSAAWTLMQKNGMRADVSWKRSAARYAALFRTLVNGAST
jgi:starch synthase